MVRAGNQRKLSAPYLTTKVVLLQSPMTCSSNTQHHSQAITHCTMFLFPQTINELFRQL